MRIKAAYDKGDKTALSELLAECDVIIQKLHALYEAHRASWMEYNKPFGWEVHDIRYGGLITRFGTVKERISDYLNGKTEHIEELEFERIRFDGILETTEKNPAINNKFLWMGYGFYATPNIL